MKQINFALLSLLSIASTNFIYSSALSKELETYDKNQKAQHLAQAIQTAKIISSRKNNSSPDQVQKIAQAIITRKTLPNSPVAISGRESASNSPIQFTEKSLQVGSLKDSFLHQYTAQNFKRNKHLEKPLKESQNLDNELIGLSSFNNLEILL